MSKLWTSLEQRCQLLDQIQLHSPHCSAAKPEVGRQTCTSSRQRMPGPSPAPCAQEMAVGLDKNICEPAMWGFQRICVFPQSKGEHPTQQHVIKFLGEARVRGLPWLAKQRPHMDSREESKPRAVPVRFSTNRSGTVEGAGCQRHTATELWAHPVEQTGA